MIRLGLCALLLVVGCEGRESSTAAPVEPAAPIIELTPREAIGWLQAELAVVTAVDAGAMDALRKVESAGSEHSLKPPADLVQADTVRFTVFFGANNHGERNDCGCKKNPLGGLGRRHTMLRALTQGGASKIWADAGPATGPVFHVDAGDLLFANNTVNRSPPPAQKAAKYDAESVVRGLDTYPPDAVGVGEHDLVFGAEFLRDLTKKASFPVLSANVRTANGELAFKPSVVVERDGVKVGFVAITKAKTRFEAYWADRKLTVDPPFEAAKRAIGELPKVDAVVLLSNVGLVETQALVERLRTAGVKLELAVVSSTNRMTAEPEFAGGTPVLEPLSRGKYVGRADFWLNGTELEFRNASIATPSSLRSYRRAVRSYWSNRKQVIRERLKIAELKLSLETIVTNDQPDASAVVDELTKRRTESIEAQTKRKEIYVRRVESTSSALLSALRKVRPPTEAPRGDDWVSATVAPVKIGIVQEKSTRKVLDKREKRRPEAAPITKKLKR